MRTDEDRTPRHHRSHRQAPFCFHHVSEVAVDVQPLCLHGDGDSSTRSGVEVAGTTHARPALGRKEGRRIQVILAPKESNIDSNVCYTPLIMHDVHGGATR
jgi:hypothetical protein